MNYAAVICLIVGYAVGFFVCLWGVVAHEKYPARHSKRVVPMPPEPISLFEDRLYDPDTVATVEAIFEGYEYSRVTDTIVDLEAVTHGGDEEEPEGQGNGGFSEEDEG